MLLAVGSKFMSLDLISDSLFESGLIPNPINKCAEHIQYRKLI